MLNKDLQVILYSSLKINVKNEYRGNFLLQKLRYY